MLVFAADLHIRATIPDKRTDDYFECQARKFNQIIEICLEENAPLIVAGDFGDKPEWPNWLLVEYSDYILVKHNDLNIYLTLGQHDLPGNYLANVKRGGMQVLHIVEAINFGVENSKYIDELIDFVHYGEKIPENSDKKVLVCHTLVCENGIDFPSAETAAGFIRKHRNYELIIVGDNHKHFIKTIGKTTLISPGSMMRMSINQKDHKPCVILYDEKLKEFEIKYLDIEPAGEVFSETVETKKEKDARLLAYVESMKKGVSVSVSFERNIEAHLEANKIDKRVKSKIWQAMETL